MKRTILLSLCILLSPAFAHAHAVPLESAPASSAFATSTPTRVEIRFSERIDPDASRIKVTGPSGTVVSDALPSKLDSDSYWLSVGLKDDGSGAYLVEWSVVSEDDGHFTKGAYPFAVGEGVMLDSSLVSDTEIIQIRTQSEIVGMTVELFGHGLMWALLAFVAFALRPLLKASKIHVEGSVMRRSLRVFACVGGSLAILGGVLQVWFKSRDLAMLHESGFFSAVFSYAHTAAGEATVIRIVAAAAFLIVAIMGVRKITASHTFTWVEALLAGILAIFAFERAKISHATANHFHPDVSIAVNFVHLIEKDIWAGLIAILLATFLFKRTREYFVPLMAKISTMLSFTVGALAITGSYIIWLHLRTFENLLTTQWGIAFLHLFAAAALLIAIRLYHAAAHACSARVFEGLLPYTLAAEFVLALLVIYTSSAVIITSPPPQEPMTPVYSAVSEGAKVTLEQYKYRDGYLRIKIENASGNEKPAAALKSEFGTSLELQLEENYPGSYLFPSSLLKADEQYELEVRVPQKDAYDAVADFEIPRGAFDSENYPLSKRPLDTFSTIMIIAAAMGVLLAAGLHVLTSRRETQARMNLRVDLAAIVKMILGGIAAFMAAWALFLVPPILAPYRATCEADGNMWHIMQPSRAGTAQSSIPREGCMWGMGAYPYMFPEMQEYEYFMSLPRANANVTFDSAPIAGHEASFKVAITYDDGAPARLFVDMEKLVHVVIVSKDQTVFAHVHPDDGRELTQQEKDTSAFRLSYVFPKAGDYLVSVDFANGLTLESRQFPVHVGGYPAQNTGVAVYSSPANIDGYDVSIKYSQPFAGEVSTFVYDIRKDGKPAELQPYLSAAMHIAVVQNDFAAFAHTHGEVHPPGAVLPPIIIKDGKLIHSMASMYTPPVFAYPVDAHVIFPKPGLYTLWGQFKSGGEVHAVPFTVRVEE